MFIEDPDREYGNGIPKYTEDDLLSKEKIYDYALDVVKFRLEKENWKIINIEGRMNMDTSVSAMIGEKRTFIAVKAGIYPEFPELEDLRKTNLLLRCFSFGAYPAFSAVSIFSEDPIRKEKRLALKGDRYSYEIKPLQMVSINDIKDNTLRGLTTFGLNLKANMFDDIVNKLTDDCKITNNIDGEDNSKEKNLELIKEYCKKISSGYYFMKVYYYKEGLQFVNFTTHTCFPRCGYPVLTINEIHGQKVNDLVFELSFNKQNKITSIEIRPFFMCSLFFKNDII